MENNEPTNQLYTFAWVGDTSGMEKLLAAGLNPNAKSKGETPLAKATWEQHEQAVRLLLSYKADPNIQNETSLHTALHKAAYRNNLPILLMLLEARADVNLKNRYGNTALHEAACVGGMESVRALIQASASVFEKNLQGLTPRECALKENHPETAAYLQNIEKTFPQRKPHAPAAKP